VTGLAWLLPPGKSLGLFGVSRSAIRENRARVVWLRLFSHQVSTVENLVLVFHGWSLKPNQGV
jgi:hypothetical protein